MTPQSPHDRLFHFVFRHPAHLATWLATALPAPIADAIDWNSLASASERLPGPRLRSHFADLVFTVRLAGCTDQLWLVVEHKAWSDPSVQGQLLRYLVHLRRAAMRRSEAPPLCAALLLQHGGAMPEQDDTFPGLPTAPWRDALLALQPRLRLVVDDVSGHSERQLLRAGLTALAQLTLLCLECLPRCPGDEALDAIARWGDLLRAVEEAAGPPLAEDAIDAIGWYLLEVTDVGLDDLQMAFQKHLTQYRSPIMSTAERIRQESLSQGLSQGLRKGLSQGRAATLERLLQRRFGPLSEATMARLQAATSDELDRWTDRLLDAASLDALFAD